MPPAILTALSSAIGFALMWPVGWLFDTMQWSVFHGWGLAHGSRIIAWPAATLVAGVGLFAIGRVINKRRSPGAPMIAPRRNCADIPRHLKSVGTMMPRERAQSFPSVDRTARRKAVGTGGSLPPRRIVSTRA